MYDVNLAGQKCLEPAKVSPASPVFPETLGLHMCRLSGFCGWKAENSLKFISNTNNNNNSSSSSSRNWKWGGGVFSKLRSKIKTYAQAETETEQKQNSHELHSLCPYLYSYACLRLDTWNPPPSPTLYIDMHFHGWLQRGVSGVRHWGFGPLLLRFLGPKTLPSAASLTACGPPYQMGGCPTPEEGVERTTKLPSSHPRGSIYSIPNFPLPAQGLFKKNSSRLQMLTCRAATIAD